MENISQIFKTNLKNIFKQSSDEDLEIFSQFTELLTPIIVSENNLTKIESFNSFINFGKHPNTNRIQDSESSQSSLQFAYHSTVLFLYVLDLNKDFKNSLLVYLKEKKLKNLYEKISKNFFDLVGLTNTLKKVNENRVDLAHLRLKLKIFNKFNDFCQILFDSNNFITKTDELTDTFLSFISQVIQEDLEIHFSNINEEVIHSLTNFLKYFYTFFRIYFKKTIHDEERNFDSEYLNNLYEKMKSNLVNHVIQSDLVGLHKDLEFNFSNAILLILRNLNSSLDTYVRNSIELISVFEKYFGNLLIYTRTFLLNLTNESEEFFELILNRKFPIFEQFVEKVVFKNLSINSLNTNHQEMSILEFYQLFLENDFKSNYAQLINEIFLIIAIKLSQAEIENPNNKNLKSVSIFLEKNQTLSKMFSKMSRDKIIFSILDDNYFYIFETFNSNLLYKFDIEKFAFDYLNNLLAEKHRLTVIEAKLFKFIPLKFSVESEDKEEKLKLMNNYFKYIFSKPYDKKNLTLINEYIKIFFDFFFVNFEKNFLEVYSYFLKVFPEHFFNYLLKVQIKDLKFFNNIMINLEKSNKSLYSILVYEFYKKIFLTDEEKNFSTVQKYSVLFTLLKPFKNHKKTISIGDKEEILFELGKASEIGKHLELNFSIKIKDLKNLSKSADRFVVIYLIDFVQGLDQQDKIFPIVKSLLKYNMKTSYAEFKSSILKTLQTYFKDYVEKILKSLGKNRLSSSEVEFLKNSLKNFEFLFKFLSANIYDRPVENVLVYLEILNYVVELFESHKSDNGFMLSSINLCKNENCKDLTMLYVKLLDEHVYNKGLAFSLISLLRQSWYFVRSNAFAILKNKKFKSVLCNEQAALLAQIKMSMFSLRQMDAEGSVNLFLFLLHHFDSEFAKEFFGNFSADASSDIFGSDSSKEMNTKLQCVEILQKIIESKEKNYFHIVSATSTSYSDFEVSDASFSIHTMFLFIRNILEDLKDSNVEINQSEFNFLLHLGHKFICINTQFTKHLLNNGVSEFMAVEDNPQGDYDSEDKSLISLWCSTKYSIDCLRMILEIFESNQRTFSKSENFSQTLRFIEEKYLDEITRLMLDYKHMGAIDALKDCLSKTAKILNKSEENFKECASERIKKFINFSLVQEEVCCTLRRSAGIPFIITTLIKSYISHDKLSTFSHNKVIEILKATIEDLLRHFLYFQNSNADVAIHCLHILRVISDDTNLKIFAREFYDYMIFQIVDGLVNENWSIKNACMLLFSRLIKNNFSLFESANTKEKKIPTFVEYFSNKEDLKNKIFSILRKEVENENIHCNDSLVLLITLFSKLKKSKLSEINEEDLKLMIEILFSLCYKNNKLSRKLLSSAIISLYGDSLEKENDASIIYVNILNLFEKLSKREYKVNDKEIIKNNVYDFVFDLLNDLVKMKKLHISDDFCKKIVYKFNEIISESNKSCENDKNYFVRYKLIKLLTKISESEEKICSIFDDINFYLEDDLIHVVDEKRINILPILDCLKINSKIPFFYKYLKNILKYLFRIKKFKNFSKFDSFDLIEKSNEELFNYLLKNHPDSLFSEFDKMKLLNEENIKNLISKQNVNITLKILDFIESDKDITSILEKNTQNNLAENLLKIFIEIINKNQTITKLVKRLLILIPKLTLNSQKFQEIFQIIEAFSNSSNQEKIRHTALLAFDKILKKSFDTNSKNLNQILKIFILILNDEHPEIRSYACKIYTSFINDNEGKANNLYANYSSCIKHNSDLICSNEFLIKNILDCITHIDSNGEYLELVIYLITENLYFLKSKAELNTENKVFYYEPDNRYIDNVELKVSIMRSLLISVKSDEEFLMLVDQVSSRMKNVGDSNQNEKMNVLVMLEVFVEFFTNNFNGLIRTLREESFVDKNDSKYLFLYLRKYLYK